MGSDRNPQDEEEGKNSGNLIRTKTLDEEFDDWETVSFSEVDLDGMEDPFKDRWKNIERKYLDMSEHKQYQTFKLKTFIVKSNDDLR